MIKISVANLSINSLRDNATMYEMKNSLYEVIAGRVYKSSHVIEFTPWCNRFAGFPCNK